MCGIWGVVSRGYTENRICGLAKDFTIAGAVRGVDSVGIFQVDKKSKVFYTKRAIAAGDFLEVQGVRALISDVDGSRLTVGHHRAATNGKVTDDNAHPFLIDVGTPHDFIGCHNGSLTTWDRKNFDVDSHWALDSIAKEGTDFLEEIKGPFVFTWYDPRTPDKAYIARGTGRPMHITTIPSKDGKAPFSLVFASEAGMLSWLIDRNSLLRDDILSVPENTLVTLDLKDVGSYTAKKFSPKLVSYSGPSYSGYTGYYANRDFIDDSNEYLGYNGQYSSSPTYSRTPTITQKLFELIAKAKEEENTASTTSSSVSQETSTKPRVPIDSIQKAKDLDLYRKEVIFQATDYDPKTRTVSGEAVDTDTGTYSYTAKLHGVDENLGEALMCCEWATCEIMAVAKPSLNPLDDKPTLILSKPKHVWPGTDKERAAKVNRLLNERKKSSDSSTVH